MSHTIKFMTVNGDYITAPPMTEDDGFNSNPRLGSIAYRLPALWDLFGQSQDEFDNTLVMYFFLSVDAVHDLAPISLACKN
jgi:hypothetical protein